MEVLPLPTFIEDVISGGQVRLVIGEPACISAHHLEPWLQLAMVRAHPPIHPTSNWLEPILAPTTPQRPLPVNCWRGHLRWPKWPLGLPYIAPQVVEEASLSWPNGPLGRSGVACCEAKGCAVQCHPEKARWVKLPPTCLLLQYSKRG